MIHASATPVTARPALVVETLDHSAGSGELRAYGMEAAAAGTARFTFCAQIGHADTPLFTFCAQNAPTDGSGAGTMAQPVVEADALTGSWI